ncbi:MAG: galactokinase [Treponema sp.]|nr:galactokinase [Treponema sp.]
MTYKNFNEIIHSKEAIKAFSGIYGENETDTQQKRYSQLASKMQSDFPKSELENTCDGLRLFSSPGRTELAGNHTDHNRGKVLAASIQLDNAAVILKRNDNVVFLRSTGFSDVKIKLTDNKGNFDLQPKPEETGKTEALIRGIAAEFHKRGCPVGGFSANAESTVLPGSGLSSSAALETLIGRIFDSLYGEGMRSPLEISRIGQIAENNYFGKPCGLMDQTACATGGAAAIDFKNTENPIVKKIKFNPDAAGYSLCVVNTGGNHADLTADYASIPSEMKSVAAYFGKSVLREINKETVLSSARKIRQKLGDRALLRSLHFFDENERVNTMTLVLQAIENIKRKKEIVDAFKVYLNQINESGESSWQILQNVYSPNNPADQGITTALALTRDFIKQQCSHNGAYRVHGGGFAGTIQAYVPVNAMSEYTKYMETIFGAGSVTPLTIRQTGATEIIV